MDFWNKYQTLIEMGGNTENSRTYSLFSWLFVTFHKFNSPTKTDLDPRISSVTIHIGHDKTVHDQVQNNYRDNHVVPNSVDGFDLKLMVQVGWFVVFDGHVVELYFVL